MPMGLLLSDSAPYAKILRAVLLILILSQAALWMWLMREYLQPASLKYNEIPFRVISKQVHYGDRLLIEVDRCQLNHVPHSYLVVRELVPLSRESEGATVSLGATSVWHAPGCEKVISSFNVVPSGIAPGRYYMRGVTEANDRLRPHTIQWYTEPFEVMPP